jgi:hypothetical protein
MGLRRLYILINNIKSQQVTCAKKLQYENFLIRLESEKMELGNS